MKTRYNIYYTQYNLFANANIPKIRVVETEDVYHEVGKMICSALERIVRISYTHPTASIEECEKYWIERGDDTIGNQGILKLLADADDRSAEFRSVIGYCAPNSEPKIFLGKVKGEIAVEERGNLGFAFDPIFYVPSEGKTFGELTTDEKNQFSHRKNSLKKFIEWYTTQD